MILTIWETQWMQIVLTALATGFAGLVTYAFTLLNAWLKTKIKNEKLQKLIEVMSSVIETAVQSVFQTFVSQLKTDGKFDKEAQKKALEMTITKAKANITAEARAEIEEFFGDFDAWLEDQIEAYISLALPHKSDSVIVSDKKRIDG